MNISVVQAFGHQIFKQVQAKLKAHMEKKNIPISENETKFWRASVEGKFLIRTLSGSTNLGPLTLFKKVRYIEMKYLGPTAHSEENIPEYSYYGWSFKVDDLSAYLTILGVKGDDPRSRFLSFCQACLVNEKENENKDEKGSDQEKYSSNLQPTLKKNTNGQIISENVSQELIDYQFGHLWGAVRISKQPKIVRPNLNEWLESKATNLCQTYSHYLCGTNWWLFFYGYDKLNLKRDRDSWNLVKLVLKFEDVVDGEIIVKIDNTYTPEHYDFIGKTDFRTSKNELLVLNFVTDPHYTRQLNMKIHVGIGDGELFLGQYLNYEGNGNIISGSVILQSAADIPEENLIPTVLKVPKLRQGQKMYETEHEGVSRHILQYMHDKKKNFRRTTLRAGHSLKGLGDWLEARLENEEN